MIVRRVKSYRWYIANSDIFGNINTNTDVIFLESMARYCGSVLKLEKEVAFGNLMIYKAIGKGSRFYWTDDFFVNCNNFLELE